jgi:hypothetical protein
MPLASPALDGDGGAVNSSKVVSVSERDAVACIWWSESCSDPRREFLAMAAVVCECRGTWRVYQQCVKGSIGLLLVRIHGLREGGQVSILVTGAMGWRAAIVVVVVVVVGVVVVVEWSSGSLHQLADADSSHMTCTR